MRRIAVLGGAGFAGQHVMDALAPHGQIRSFSRRSGCDLLADTHELVEFAPDCIVNCAAETGSIHYVNTRAAHVLDTNMRMLLNVFQIAASMDVLLVNPIASCGYPGEADLYVEHELWRGPVHETVLSFGSTRRMIDTLARCYKREHGLRTCNVVVPNMYGPGDSTDPNRTHALNALVLKFLQNTDTIEVWGSGLPIREWLYVKDFARVIAQVVSEEREIELLNIAQAEGHSINEIVRIIADEVGFGGRITHDLSRPDGALKKVMSRTLFEQAFPGFTFTPLRDGIRETIAYYSTA